MNMPSPCCIPGCNSNYQTALKAGAERVSVFHFPKNEKLKIQWLKNIPRADWSPTQFSVVCAKHFVPSDIIREDIFLLPDGTTKKIPTKVRLNLTAVPCIFPTYLPKTVPITRKSTAERNKEHQESTTQLNQAFEESDLIKSFEDLENYSQTINVSEFWEERMVSGSKIYFYSLGLTKESINIVNQVSVDSDMKVHIYLNGNKWVCNDLKLILPFEMKLSRWSQLENLLSRYHFIHYESQ